MEYKTVYEVIDGNFETYVLAILAAIILTVALSFTINHLKSDPQMHPNRDKISILGFAVSGFLLLYLTMVSLVTKPEFYSTNQKYNNNDFKITEGIVEEFDPMPREGHKYESFKVNGVYFEYSDFAIFHHGFSNSASHGGPINSNGQEVRLGYITLIDKGRTKDIHTNIIVKIDVKETN